MTTKQGTGEEIGSIEVNDEFEINFVDDGHNDAYTYVILDSNQGQRKINVFLEYRNEIGDEQLAEDLENVEGDNYTSLL